MDNAPSPQSILSSVTSTLLKKPSALVSSPALETKLTATELCGQHSATSITSTSITYTQSSKVCPIPFRAFKFLRSATVGDLAPPDIPSGLAPFWTPSNWWATQRPAWGPWISAKTPLATLISNLPANYNPTGAWSPTS
eukprot:CAMPEP_0202476778 /NCGR_PEP_ID=MMETSP1360-20130828/93597_1 /ASSEMBLY_ACC=CAM_ASM_000848 /TAXON_ID=515479 /ORGANISM="Licmophora paradoxa, Strain CCMP2313" /LENGTH=138 /DNA_ID=CAMNT_0049103993 /DNA_START=241 /DNA_END=658 /DNA_ORIENTATION=-